MGAQSATDRTIRGLLWVGGGKGIQFTAQLFVLAVLARLLTPHEFGVVTAAVLIAGIGQIFSEIGVGPSIVQKTDLTKTDLRAGFYISVLLSLVIASTLSELSARLHGYT